jgi:ligand-binding sensor domain-containing protein
VLWIRDGTVEHFMRISRAALGHRDWASALAADRLQGGLWLGFFQGGVAYFKDGRIRTTYTANTGLGEGRVTDLRLDPDGAIWAATDRGTLRGSRLMHRCR